MRALHPRLYAAPAGKTSASGCPVRQTRSGGGVNRKRITFRRFGSWPASSGRLPGEWTPSHSRDVRARECGPWKDDDVYGHEQDHCKKELLQLQAPSSRDAIDDCLRHPGNGGGDQECGCQSGGQETDANRQDKTDPPCGAASCPCRQERTQRAGVSFQASASCSDAGRCSGAMLRARGNDSAVKTCVRVRTPAGGRPDPRRELPVTSFQC